MGRSLRGNGPQGRPASPRADRARQAGRLRSRPPSLSSAQQGGTDYLIAPRRRRLRLVRRPGAKFERPGAGATAPVANFESDAGGNAGRDQFIAARCWSRPPCRNPRLSTKSRRTTASTVPTIPTSAAKSASPAAHHEGGCHQSRRPNQHAWYLPPRGENTSPPHRAANRRSGRLSCSGSTTGPRESGRVPAPRRFSGTRRPGGHRPPIPLLPSAASSIPIPTNRLPLVSPIRPSRSLVPPGRRSVTNLVLTLARSPGSAVFAAGPGVGQVGGRL